MARALEVLGLRLAAYDESGDPRLVLEPAAISDAERAVAQREGGLADIETWRQLARLHHRRGTACLRKLMRTTPDCSADEEFVAAAAILAVLSGLSGDPVPAELIDPVRRLGFPPPDADTSPRMWAAMALSLIYVAGNTRYDHIRTFCFDVVRRARIRFDTLARDATSFANSVAALRSLSYVLLHYCAQCDDAFAVEEFAEVARRGCIQIAEPDDELPVQRVRLALALVSRHLLTTKMDPLDEAMSLLVHADVPDGRDPGPWLVYLGWLLSQCLPATPRADIVQKVIDTYFHAALVTDGQQRLDSGRTLIATLRGHEAQGEVVEFAYLGVVATPPGTPERRVAEGELCRTLIDRFEHTGQFHHLDSIVRVAEILRTASSPPGTHDELVTLLASSLLNSYVVHGDESVLIRLRELRDSVVPAAARRTVNEALERAEQMCRDPLLRLELLSDLMWTRYSKSRDSRELEDAVAAMRQTAEASDPGRPEHTRYLANLANILLQRAGAIDDTEANPQARTEVVAEAVEAARVALDAMTTDDPLRPKSMLILGNALVIWPTETMTTQLAERARAVLTEGSANAPPMLKPQFLGFLAEAIIRQVTTGSDSRPDSDMDDAVDFAREAVDLAAGEDARPLRRFLVSALLLRFSRRRDTRDLEEALALSAMDGDYFPELRRLSILLGEDDDGEAWSSLTAEDTEKLIALTASLLAESRDATLTTQLIALIERAAAQHRRELVGADHLLAVARKLVDDNRHSDACLILIRSASVFGTAGAHQREAVALGMLGDVYLALGQWAAADTLTTASTRHRRLGRPTEEVRFLASSAEALIRQGDSDTGLARYLTAIERCGELGLTNTEADFELRRGDAFLSLGDTDGAVACFERGYGLLASGTDTRSLLGAIQRIVPALIALGRFSRASELAAGGVDAALSADDWRGAAGILYAYRNALNEGGHTDMVRETQARLVDLFHRHAGAKTAADLAFAFAQESRHEARLLPDLAAVEERYRAIGDLGGVAAVYRALGLAHARAGTVDEGLGFLRKAAGIYADRGSFADACESLLAAAVFLFSADRETEAVGDIEEAEGLAARSGAPLAMFHAAHMRARLEMRTGMARAARDYLAAARQHARGHPLLEGLVLTDLAGLADKDGDLAQAYEDLQTAAGLFGSDGPTLLQAHALIRAGLVLERLGEQRRALEMLQEGTDLLADAPAEPLHLDGDKRYEVFGDATVDVPLLVKLARLHLNAGDLPRALAALRRAAALDPADEVLAGRLRVMEMVQSGHQGDPRRRLESALAMLDDAPPEAGRAGTERALWFAALSKASFAARELGELQLSYDLARRGVDTAASGGPLADQLRNLGLAARELGRGAESLTHLERAAAISVASQGQYDWTDVPVLISLANTLIEQGRWTQAEQVLESGFKLAPPPSRERATLLGSRGNLRRARGDLDAALADHREAISIAESLGDDGMLGAGYANLAEIHRSRGELIQARELTLRALELERAAGRQTGVVLDLLNLGVLSWEEDQRTDAVEYWEQAMSLAEETGFAVGRAEALINLGAADIAGSAAARGHARLTEALTLMRGAGQPQLIASVLDNRSRAAADLGDAAGALDDAVAACEAAEALGAVAGSSYYLRLRRLQDRAIRLAGQAGQGRLTWALIDRAKAGVLASYLGYQQWPTPTGVDPVALAEEKALLDEQRALMTAWSLSPDPARRQNLHRRLTAARSALDAVWEGMGADAESYVALRRGATVSPERLVELIRAHRPEDRIGFLQFHAGERTVTVVAHRTDWPEPRVFQTMVTREMLEGYLSADGSQMPGFVEFPDGHQEDVDMFSLLGQLLLRQVDDALGDELDLLYLFPDQELHRIPLHVLAPAGTSLIERYPVAYVPSAAVLARLLNRDGVPSGRASVVLGFADSEAERTLFEGEAEDVASLLGVSPLLAGSAVSTRIPGSWYAVHLSCHGVFDENDPLSSGVRLADGLLTARQMMAMPIDAGLVVLSACETGLSAYDARPGGEFSGDDVSGLGHALLYAGARSAVLTLWPVDAAAARLVARRLYSGMLAGESKAAALRAAVLELRDRTGYHDPRFWAPFLVLGQGW